MSDAQFATFWRGPLNPIAYSCLASFPATGARLLVYAYEDDLDLPPGVERADARRICPDLSLLDRYRVGGEPSIAMFADMFRYKLVRDTGCCWVDADLVCLRRPDFSGEAIVYGRQAEARGKALINNAVLKLPSDHPLLADLIQRAEAAADIDQSWGAIGPFLLTDLAEKHGVDRLARDETEFYPIDADRFWMALLPATSAAAAKAASGATFLHLWSAMFERSHYDLSACPPPGSFLHDAFKRLGTLHRFARAYDERGLSGLLSEWIARSAPSSDAALASS
ncbi:MAG TPA: hypothetical protein VKV96_13375 [Roseiarcus sp.]|nr:hypothetical protein [Roseiarcus sp.]